MHGVQLLGVQSMAEPQSQCMQARVLGMLSPWLPPASVSVSLHGATFEHRSFAILTSRSQPWLTNALVDLRLMVTLLLHRRIVSFAVGHSNTCLRKQLHGDTPSTAVTCARLIPERRRTLLCSPTW